MKHKAKYYIFLGIIFLGLLIPLSNTRVLAQEFELYSENDIFAELFPKVPGPNENVELELNSYSFNLNNYYIAWFKDSIKQTEGFGQRNFNFTTGPSGSITTITAIVEYEGQVFRKEFEFSPSEVDLLWEVSDAYTPPFYRGKTLPLKQSLVRVTAIPETLLIEPTDAPNLVYYWDKNYKRQGSASGFGKSFFEFVTDPLGISDTITVTTNDRRENSFATDEINFNLEIFNPKILIYEINEQGRLLTQKALNTNGRIQKDTIKLSFHPLFMSTIEPNFVDLFVSWVVNESSQAPQDFERQNELHISSGGRSGTTPISIELEGIEKLLQKAQATFSITFDIEDNENTSPFF
jgi:hypothetical protein